METLDTEILYSIPLLLEVFFSCGNAPVTIFSARVPNHFAIVFHFQSVIDDLYSYRDEFFESHEISKAEEKPKLLKDKLDQCLEALDRLSCESILFYFLCYNSGRQMT